MTLEDVVVMLWVKSISSGASPWHLLSPNFEMPSSHYQAHDHSLEARTTVQG